MPPSACHATPPHRVAPGAAVAGSALHSRMASWPRRCRARCCTRRCPPVSRQDGFNAHPETARSPTATPPHALTRVACPCARRPALAAAKP
eukprot:4965065-Prymnesium_polylepis.1